MKNDEAYTIWFTGRHGAGKSTIADKLVEILRKNKISVVLLDGDEIRKTVSSDLGYSLEERNKHMARVANICKLISENGILTIASVASPTEHSRGYAKNILKKMVLVYVKCNLDTCEKRDVKGHYKKAMEKKKGFENFFGMEFEEPENPDIVLNTDKETADESVTTLLNELKNRQVIKI